MRIRALLTALAILGFVPAAMAGPFFGGARHFDVIVTNVTAGSNFTPVLVASHSPDLALFEPGETASPELALLAEGGATGPLAERLEASGEAFDVQSSDGLLQPGESVTVRLKTRAGFNRISLAAMLLPTNDSFVAVNGVFRPLGRLDRSVTAPAYDAGSEPNDELCASIPGPTCGGVGVSPEAGGEGFVHISRGIQGVGDVAAGDHDWRNPVARVTIQPVRK